MTLARLHDDRHAGQRRQEPRFFARLPVTLLSSHKRDQLVTWNVSFRGMFIETERPPPLRQLVRIGMIVPATGAGIVLHGMVVNVVGPNQHVGHPQGMGIELYGVDRDIRNVWWSMVRYLRDELDQQSGIRRLSA